MFNHIMIWGSLLSYFVLDSFYNYVFGAPYVGALAKAITGSTFWLTMILTVIILMTPVLAWRFYSFECHPSLADKIRMKQRQTKQVRSKPEMLRTPSARRSRRSLRSSYAFAHEVRIFFQSFESSWFADLKCHCRKDLVALSRREKSCGSYLKTLHSLLASALRSSIPWNIQHRTAWLKSAAKFCLAVRIAISAREHRYRI